MRVYVRNAKNKAIASVLRQAVMFYSRKLLPRQLNTLTIHVHLSIDCKDKLLGDTEAMDSNHRPKQFCIRINKRLQGRQLFETIAHEMVHVKQYATDQLKDYYDTGVRYNGKIYKDDEKGYWLHPWEIEAYGMSFGLYKKFIDYYKLKPSELRIKRGKMVAARKMK